jgi:hypothetical protein
MKKEERELQWGADNKERMNVKFLLFAGLFALPLFAVGVYVFMSRGGELGGLIFALLYFAVFGFLMSLSLSATIKIRQFTAENPSYRNYPSYTRAGTSLGFFILFCMLYIANIIIFLVTDKAIGDFYKVTNPLFLFWIIPIVNNFVVLMSDERVYIGQYQKSFLIDKIRVEDFDKLDASMTKFEDYITISFHCEGIPYTATFSRKTMLELCKVLPGVHRDYSRTPNSRRSPQKFYD